MNAKLVIAAHNGELLVRRQPIFGHQIFARFVFVLSRRTQVRNDGDRKCRYPDYDRKPWTQLSIHGLRRSFNSASAKSYSLVVLSPVATAFRKASAAPALSPFNKRLRPT